MKRVKRYDRFKLDGIKKTDQGFIKTRVTTTRTGVFTYRNADGSEFKELRLPEEVFAEDTIESLKKIPVTNDHPTVPVTSENAKELTVGLTGEDVRIVQDRFLETDVTIFDQDTINDIEGGKEEVSLGYEVTLDFTPGVHNGERYDAVQRDIVNNHLAVVDRARAGRSARLHLDSGDAELVGEPNRSNFKGDVNMTKIKIDGVEYEVSEQVAAAYTAEKRRLDSEAATKDTEISNLKKDSKNFDELQGKHDALVDENKKLKERADKGDNPEVINAAVKTRINLVSFAEKKLDKDTFAKIDEMDNKEVKVAVIKADDADFNAEGKSDDYLNARFDMMVAQSKNDSDQDFKNEMSNHNQDRNDSANNGTIDLDKKRADSMATSQTSWQKPLGLSKRSQ